MEHGPGLVVIEEDPDAEDVSVPGPPAIEVPAVLFNIARQWQAGMDDDAVYDVTHGWWRMGPKREQAEYALAVAQGQVRAVFRVLGWRARREGDRDWRHDSPGRPRWGFEGEPDPDMSHLVGLDVRHLFPQGATNPVRYVNCDAAPQVRAASRRRTTLASRTTTSPSLRDACLRLHANPVLHMSLHSKELFHSNLLGWLVEAHPDLGAEVLRPWLVADADQEQLRVRREHHSLDLAIELPGYRALVVENKVFSLPDEEQLGKYDQNNLPAARLGDASRILLSLTDPGWPTWRAWQWVSYDELLLRLEGVTDELRARDAFAGSLLEHYVEMVRDVLQVAHLTRVLDDEEPVTLDEDTVGLLRPIRLHDAMQKLRARTLMHRLEGLYEQRGLSYARTEVGMTKGSVLLMTAVDLPDGDQIGWQLQASQWRRFLIAPALSGKGVEARAARAGYAAERYPSWFDFRREQDAGPFVEMPLVGFNHFDPDFVYRYVKAPGLLVGELMRLATGAVEDAAGVTPATA